MIWFPAKTVFATSNQTDICQTIRCQIFQALLQALIWENLVVTKRLRTSETLSWNWVVLRLRRSSIKVITLLPFKYLELSITMFVPRGQATQSNTSHHLLIFRGACFHRIPVTVASQYYQVSFGYPWMVYFVSCNQREQKSASHRDRFALYGWHPNSLTSHRLVQKHCASLVEDIVRYLTVR